MSSAWVAGVVSLLVAAAPAPDGAGALERAQVCAAALDFECAEAELAAARGMADSLSRDDAGILWRLSAEVALSTGRRDAALAHLGELLALDPGFAPESGAWPEVWLDALATARRLAPDRLPPTLTVTLPAEVEAGQPVTLTADASDPSGVARVTVSVKTPLETRTLVMATTDGARWTVAVPRELVEAPGLDVWAEAWDQQGNGPASWGSAGMPRRLVVNARPVVAEPAFYETWWFWTGVGVIVAGGIVAAVLLSDGGADAGVAGPAESGGANVVWLPP